MSIRQLYWHVDHISRINFHINLNRNSCALILFCMSETSMHTYYNNMLTLGLICLKLLVSLSDQVHPTSIAHELLQPSSNRFRFRSGRPNSKITVLVRILHKAKNDGRSLQNKALHLLAVTDQFWWRSGRAGTRKLVNKAEKVIDESEAENK